MVRRANGAAPHRIAGLARNSTVTLYRLTGHDSDELYNGLSLKQMLALLELYLFCLYRPRANRTFVPVSAFFNSITKLVPTVKLP